MPTAGIAFLDEVFKANSAILNALLTLLNEREFDNGAGRSRTPLISVIGASNEVPVDESLHAFHDRFLLRVPVAAVSTARFGDLLALTELDLPEATGAPVPIGAAARQAIVAGRDAVLLGADALAALGALRDFIAQQNWVMSDRRWRQAVGLLRCAALTDGRAEVDALDLWLLPYVAGSDAASVQSLADWFARAVVQAVAHDAPWLSRAVQGFEQQLEIEQQLPAEAGDSTAGKLAVARAVGGAEDNAMLRMVSATLEVKQRRHFSSVHIAARTAQVDEVIERAAADRAPVQAALLALQTRVIDRLWLPPELAQAWCGAHAQTLAVLDQCLARLHQCRAGFAALPLEVQAGPAADTLPSPASETTETFRPAGLSSHA